MKPLTKKDFSVEKNFLENRLKKLNRYTSKDEKNTFLLDENASMTEVFNILNSNPEIKPLNELESGAFLLYLRENSVDDIIETLHECECGVINDIQIPIEDMFFTDNIEETSNIPIGLFESPDDFLTEESSNNLTVKDYNELSDIIIENNKKILDITINTKCRTCGKSIEIMIYPKNFISKTNLTNLYDEYFKLSFFMNLTKSDIDELYPFERYIYLGLLKKQLESN